MQIQMTRPEKETLLYWWERVRHPTRVKNGVRHRSKSYAVELHYHHKRLNWSLGTGNREIAAQRAREIYFYLALHGWSAMRRKYRPLSSEDRDYRRERSHRIANP